MFGWQEFSFLMQYSEIFLLCHRPLGINCKTVSAKKQLSWKRGCMKTAGQRPDIPLYLPLLCRLSLMFIEENFSFPSFFSPSSPWWQIQFSASTDSNSYSRIITCKMQLKELKGDYANQLKLKFILQLFFSSFCVMVWLISWSCSKPLNSLMCYQRVQFVQFVRNPSGGGDFSQALICKVQFIDRNRTVILIAAE